MAYADRTALDCTFTWNPHLLWWESDGRERVMVLPPESDEPGSEWSILFAERPNHKGIRLAMTECDERDQLFFEEMVFKVAAIASRNSPFAQAPLAS